MPPHPTPAGPANSPPAEERGYFDHWEHATTVLRTAASATLQTGHAAATWLPTLAQDAWQFSWNQAPGRLLNASSFLLTQVPQALERHAMEGCTELSNKVLQSASAALTKLPFQASYVSNVLWQWAAPSLPNSQALCAAALNLLQEGGKALLENLQAAGSGDDGPSAPPDPVDQYGAADMDAAGAAPGTFAAGIQVSGDAQDMAPADLLATGLETWAANGPTPPVADAPDCVPEESTVEATLVGGLAPCSCLDAV